MQSGVRRELLVSSPMHLLIFRNFNFRPGAFLAAPCSLHESLHRRLFSLLQTLQLLVFLKMMHQQMLKHNGVKYTNIYSKKYSYHFLLDIYLL